MQTRRDAEFSEYRRHIRILGTNPADWTTQPLG